MILKYRQSAVVGVFVLFAAVVLLVGCSTRYTLDKGILHHDRGEFDEADRLLRHVVDEDPTSWQAMYYLGLIQLEQGDPRRASVLLDRALTLRRDAPETRQIIDALSEAIYQQNQPSNLNSLLRQATDYYGTSYDYVRQGKYLAKSGDSDGALVAFQKAERFADQDDALPHLAIADFYEQIGDVLSAIQALRRAYNILPNDPSLEDRLRKHGLVPGPSLKIASQSN